MFLGLDLGTTHVKALVVDRDAVVLGRGSAPVSRRLTPDGGVEQDIDEIWKASCQAIHAAIGDDPSHARRIEAIGVSSQGGALQLLDAQLRPLGRVISWMDGRGRPFDQLLMEELGEEFFAEHLGCRSCLITPGQILRLRQQSPDLIRQAAAIGYVGDMIVGRLCGRRAHDATSLSIAFLYHPTLNRADPDLLKRLALHEVMLPDLLPADQPAGRLTAEAAQATRLPEGIPVSPAIHDQYAASLGVGAVHDGDVSLSTGTAWAMVAVGNRLGRPVTPQAIVCPHPVRGRFGQMLSIVNGGSTIDWVARLTSRTWNCAELDGAMESVRAGCDGLIFWPHLVSLGGTVVSGNHRAASTSRRPNTSARQPAPTHLGGNARQTGGRIHGIRLAHGADHFVRAAVEGLACELAVHFNAFAASGQHLSRVVLSGGAAESRVTPQIIADTTDRPVAVVTEPFVSALGAAVVARAMVEPDRELGELAEHLASSNRRFAPGPNSTIYREVLERFLEGL